MKNKLINFIETHHLTKKKILIAVSGGIDSIVLLHLFQSIKEKFSINITACHVDHMIRNESKAEQLFVKKICQSQNIEFNGIQVNVPKYMEKKTISLEMAAHDCRYAKLIEVMKSSQSDYIATAHHFDDQLETIFMRFGFGTGIEGIQGLAEKNDFFLKPLLSIRKEKLIQYSKQNGLNFITDSSNEDNSIARNFWRNEILNKIEMRFGKAYFDKLMDTVKNINWTERDYKVLNQVSNSFSLVNNRLNISKSKLNQYPNAFLKRLIEEIMRFHFDELSLFSKVQFKQLINLLNIKQTGKQLKIGNIIIETSFDDILIYKQNIIANEIHHIEIDNSLELNSNTLKVSTVDHADFNKSSSIEFIDFDLIKNPLIVRKYKKRDIFYPFGMTGKQKINRHLKSKHIDKQTRKDAWVLCDAEKIIWLIGERLDRRYAISKQTKQILKLEIFKHN